MNKKSAQESTSAKLRVGIIGSGYIAEPHILALKRLPNVELVALADLSLARAQSLAAAFHVPRYYRDAKEMIETEKLDAVHVLVPPDAHEKVTTIALKHGAHVLAEKPIADSKASAKANAVLSWPSTALASARRMTGLSLPLS